MMSEKTAWFWATTSVHTIVDGLLMQNREYRQKDYEIQKQICTLEKQRDQLRKEYSDKYYTLIKRRRDESAEVLGKLLDEEFKPRKG